MSGTAGFALVILFVSAVGLAGVLASRLTEWVRIPTPLLVLIGAAVTVTAVPTLHPPPVHTVEQVLTVALVLVLFNGGMHMGWSRLRAAIVPVASVGVGGTVLTAAGAALVLHYGCDMDWYLAVLVATAVAPTDPTVVFSVLGRRESGTILEGESGANDPVGIALMVSLLAAGELGASAFADVGVQFVQQLLVGGAIGLLGGRVLLLFIRRVPLPSEGLYPLRTLACSLLLYGVATLAQGSGFLAVFVAGIVIGDAATPFRADVQRFHAALAGLAEIVAFAVLGMTVDLRVLASTEVWIPGLALGIALTLVIRPIGAGICLMGVELAQNERGFIAFAGLKGAVPIMLGELLRAAHVPDAERLYGIVVVVVIFSVLVQGGAVPAVARRIGLPMRTVDPEPWAIGVRLRHEPHGVHRLTVAPGSAAKGLTVEDIADRVGGDTWVMILVRDHKPEPVQADTEFHTGDEVVILADPALADALAALFGANDAD